MNKDGKLSALVTKLGDILDITEGLSDKEKTEILEEVLNANKD